MANKSMDERIQFHDSIDVMEIDFSGIDFASGDVVDEFYDQVDQRLAETNKRWYFLVDYRECEIGPEAWERFADRGRASNLTHGLGTARIGLSPEIKDQVRKRAKDNLFFRANIYESRDEALRTLEALRKRHRDNPEIDQEQTLLSVEDVFLSFGGVHALQGVGFGVKSGEIFSIIGPNGAGKTSMLNVVSGFYRPTSGRISFDGKDRTRLGPEKVARLGFARTFQNIALFKGMSTLDNIMTGRILKTKTNVLADAFYLGPTQKEEIRHREVVEKIIDFLEIQAIRRTPVGRLPYGLQKRVELGRALAMEPKVLLLDEPMAGMNVEEKEDMVRFILDVNDELGTTIMLIEHDMGVVMDISDFVVVLDHGEKISEGTPDEVRGDPGVIRAYLGEG
ncbi:MAG: ABC transporter ATP-binding protein [Kiloniellales bacterium]|nr:ABC transporter ATP-binding protein [Kiloniellales bacterium]